MKRHITFPLIAGLSIGLAACADNASPPAAPTSRRITSIDQPLLSVGSGFTATADVRANVGDFHVQSKFEGLDVELKTHDNADIEVVNQTGIPAATSGWHYHPGPVLVLVKSGVATVYESTDPTCTGKSYPAGTTLIEGTSPHILRNEGTVPLEIVAVFLVPATRARRIESDPPGNCPF